MNMVIGASISTKLTAKFEAEYGVRILTNLAAKCGAENMVIGVRIQTKLTAEFEAE